MSNLADEVMAALHEAERLVASLPAGSPERQTAFDLAAELQELCDRLNDVSLPAGVAAARQSVYAAQALLRVLAGRQDHARAGTGPGGGEPSR
jgi:hypothetical protein